MKKDNNVQNHNNPLFGEMLVKANVVDQGQLEEALLAQPDRKKKIGEVLVDLQYASEKEILKAVADYYDISASALSVDIESLIKKKKIGFVRRIFNARFSIRFRLSLMVVTLILATIFSLSFVILNQQSKELYQQTVRTGKVSLSYFSSNARIPLLKDNTLRLNTLIKEATSVEGLLYAIIIDRDHNIKAHTETKQLGTAFQKFSGVLDETVEGEVSYYNYSKDGKNILNLTSPVKFQNKILGEVHVGVSLDFIDQQVARAQFNILLISIVIIVLGLIAGFFLSGRFTKPIVFLDRSAQVLARGDLEHLIDISGKDELGSLARSFDHMRLSIKKKIEDLQILTKAYSRFVPREFLELLEKDSIVHVGLGDNVQMTVSVLFSDIRSFTSISEKMSPKENFEFLNRYLYYMNPVITENKGFIDKYIGDAIMALFPHDVEDSVKAAIGMNKALAVFNEERKKQGTFPVHIGIGINSGLLMLGTIGGEDRMEGTVISDAVNLASRVEGMTKMYGASLLISDQTFKALKNPSDYHYRIVDHVAVKGKTKPITVYEFFDGDTPKVRDGKIAIMKDVKAGLSAYNEQKFKDAKKIFENCLIKTPEDKFLKLYVDRCEKMADMPFIENWDRVTRLTTK